MNLRLEPTADIIAAVAQREGAPVCIAFAAESGRDAAAVTAARRKMREKAVDAIVLAPVEANLGGDDCDLILLARGLRKDLGPMSKRRAAGLLIEHVAALLRRADKPARKAGLRRV